MAINKQPLFAGTPILKCITIDPPVINDNGNTKDGNWNTPPTSVYSNPSAYGAIIDRITISATADITNKDVTAKLVYVYLYDNSNSTYSLYKTLSMPATLVDEITPNPELELTFQGGLILKDNDKIYIGASVNYGSLGRTGDYLSITIEGGTYTAQ